MAKFVQFSFEESIRSERPSKYNFLNLNQSNEELILLRLMLGTIKVKNNLNGLTIRQNTNYCSQDFSQWQSLSRKSIINFLSAEGIDLDSMHDYYSKSITFGNKKFYKSILLELSNYIYQKQKDSHATAFLHLYRIIELISYSFPLVYSSRATSYEKTFNNLKDYFHKVDSELNFFKQFVNGHLFKDNAALLDISLNIPITAPNQDLQEQYFKAIKKLCDNNSKSIPISGSTNYSEIIITRRGLTSLIYDLRNRYFHLLTGGYNNNFDSNDIMEVDLFYKNVNDIICNWIGVIYLEVTKLAYEVH
ncbi:hypothetical protein MUN84_09145 [Hymenobacter sp. 5516J-16]|uniref:hypothetical protein n=1 Tax=Hymenobacter sp. 5516J-16 TaxID=2932253 RepID=UPI001FD4749A|nr:hypothetical protein [Hymenobacter sp. 5516J-16]UOQ78675.1 hypothetical protein MUN84_09145 [Hymenobacter sp. 5516J-16]